MKARFLTEYSDILYYRTITLFDRNETYLEIRFDKFIERLFPQQKKFIERSSFDELRKTLKCRYGNDSDCFVNLGVLQIISIDKLKFYQTNVGVSGPKHSDFEQPVYILKYSNFLLLYNGYHRTLSKIMKNEMEIEGYILSLD